MTGRSAQDPLVMLETPLELTSRGLVDLYYYPSDPVSVNVGARIRKRKKEKIVGVLRMADICE